MVSRISNSGISASGISASGISTCRVSTSGISTSGISTCRVSTSGISTSGSEKRGRDDPSCGRERLIHPFPPLYDSYSRILILGSFPSVKSREMAFFYGHPQNRFWKVVSSLLEEPFPETVPARRQMLLAHGIALWDVIASCEIRGSSDASIRNAVPNDLGQILEAAQIRQVFVNGQTAGRLYHKHQERNLCEQFGKAAEAVVLPSTSPANAAWNLDRLREEWRVILRYL